MAVALARRPTIGAEQDVDGAGTRARHSWRPALMSARAADAVEHDGHSSTITKPASKPIADLATATERAHHSSHPEPPRRPTMRRESPPWTGSGICTG